LSGFHELSEPLLLLAAKNDTLAAPIETYLTRVQGVIRQYQFGSLLLAQPPFHQREIKVFVAAVKFVAYDGMSDMREVNADLMFATGARNHTEQRERSAHPIKPSFHGEFGSRRCAVRAHTIFDRNFARFVLSERRVNFTVFLAHVPVDKGDIFLFHRPALPDFPKLSRRIGILGYHGYATRFPIEPVDQMRLRVWPKMQAHATDEA